MSDGVQNLGTLKIPCSSEADFEREWSSLEGQFIRRKYRCKYGISREDLDLERGDTVPSHTSYLIRQSVVEKFEGSNATVVTVVGFHRHLWSTGSGWVEVEVSRVQTEDPYFFTFELQYEVPFEDLTLGANGYSHASMPSIGDDLPYGTFTLTPTCQWVRIRPKGGGEGSKALVMVRYKGRIAA